MEVGPERERIARMVEDWEQDGKKLPFPRPSVVVDSGGGFQCFWLLLSRLPRRRMDRHPEVEARNIAIGVAMGADACHNIDRIMRLPGTVNVPGEKKRAKGRTPRLARVVAEDWSLRHRARRLPRSRRGARRGGDPAKANTALTRRGGWMALTDLPAGVSDRTARP